MTTLAEAEKTFAAALRETSIAPANTRGPRTERRYSVYRNDMAVNLAACLTGRYPAVRRLVGSRFFREMVRQYIAAEPPLSPVLMFYGERFPGFIDSFGPAAPIPYLGAVARIELARGLAYHAAEASPIEARDFAALPLRQLMELRVALHPSVSIVSSPYPVYSIWSINQSRAPTVPISPWAGESALVARPRRTVEVTKLAGGEAAFLGALAESATIAEAIERAYGAFEGFDLPQAFARLVRARIVVGFGRPAFGHAGVN